MIVIKSAVTKDGRPYQVARMEPTARQPKGARVRFFGREIGFTELHMYALGRFAVNVIKERVARGIGSDDAAMPPLQGGQQLQRWSKSQQKWVRYGKAEYGYRTWKIRQGLPGVRNLTLTGKMLDDFSVRSVSASEVRMDITTTASRQKARVNELRAPWFGWSAQDTVSILGRARELFGQVGNVGLSMVERGAGIVTRTVAPIWMRGFQYTHPKSLDARAAEEQWRTRTVSVRPHRARVPSRKAA